MEAQKATVTNVVPMDYEIEVNECKSNNTKSVAKFGTQHSVI